MQYNCVKCVNKCIVLHILHFWKEIISENIKSFNKAFIHLHLSNRNMAGNGSLMTYTEYEKVLDSKGKQAMKNISLDIHIYIKSFLEKAV